MRTLEKERFEVTTVETAPEASKASLIAAEKKYGFAANIFGVMGNHPGLLNGYLEATTQLVNNSVLTPKEREIAFLATSFENECNYCMSAHSAVAGMLKVDTAVLEALSNGIELPDQKLNALAAYVRATTVKRGQVSQDDIAQFLKAGYSQKAMLEVVLIVGLKVLTNYTDHVGKVTLDEVFHDTKWTANT